MRHFTLHAFSGPFAPLNNTPLLLVILSDSDGAPATEEEPKEPEGVSLAMQIQGVFLRDCPRRHPRIGKQAAGIIERTP